MIGVMKRRWGSRGRREIKTERDTHRDIFSILGDVIICEFH